MEAKSVDPGEFRAGQRKQWDSAATGWRKWSEMIDTAATKISEGLVERAGVKEGDRVLDVACGYGEPSLTAARRAGPEGSVVATDIAPQMLAHGRERAASAGLDNIEFVETAASALDFPESSFDAAISRWGIIFEPDGEAAAARVRSALKDGSRFAISSWGPPETVPFLAIPMGTVMRELGVDPPPPGTPGPLSRPTPEALGGLLEGGGFSDVEVAEDEVGFEWESAEQVTTFMKEIAPPITAMMAGHPPDVQEKTWAAVTEAFAQQAGESGTINLTNKVLLASGRA